MRTLYKEEVGEKPASGRGEMVRQWIDVRDVPAQPMAGDMAQLHEMDEAATQRPRGFRAWLEMRRRDPARRTH